MDPPPQNVHLLVPRTCECYLTVKRDLADGIGLRILRWGESPGLSGWALNVITTALMVGGQDEQKNTKVMQ